VVLEGNHVMFKFRSESSAIVGGVERALFEDQNSGAYIGELFDLTSKRIGFLGRGFGSRSIGKTLALAAGVANADKIPEASQLSTMAQVMQDAQGGLLGHNALLQQAARLGATTYDNYGRRRAQGTSVPLREDFNILDDPFFWAPGGVGPVNKPGITSSPSCPATTCSTGPAWRWTGSCRTGRTYASLRVRSGREQRHQRPHARLAPPELRDPAAPYRSFPLVELLT
jgi:hypothetical protein